MAIGTEELIVQAVERLLMQKKVKKLTVKDIVEECGKGPALPVFAGAEYPTLCRAWPADQLPGRNYADGRGTAVCFLSAGGGKARPVRPMQSLGVKARYALSQSGGSWHPQELVRGRQR